MSENKRIYYLPGYAIGDKALKQDVKLAAQEMRDAIREAREKGYIFPGDKPRGEGDDNLRNTQHKER
jgi:proteasome assembly chaperone (PAC2) family protein